MLRRLSTPSPTCQALARRAGNGAGTGMNGGRTMRVTGPATLTIHVS